MGRGFEPHPPHAIYLRKLPNPCGERLAVTHNLTHNEVMQTLQQISEDIAALRRTATFVRASRQPKWLETAMDLERMADERERELRARITSAPAAS